MDIRSVRTGNKKRFKCEDCEHQDHSDRGASVNTAVKGIRNHQDWNMPALNSLPIVRKVRRRASGVVDAPIAAVGRELDASVVSADGDLTHEETKQVIDVEEY